MQDQSLPAAAARVLLVDDDRGYLRVLQIRLEEDKRISFVIETADTLAAALKILQEKTFQLVLLDLGLPDSQGLGTFEKIVESHPEIACVILSGTDDEALALKAVKKGAQDYVVKGEIRGEMLARVLAHALERHIQKREVAELNERLEKLSFLDPLTSSSIVAAFNARFPGNLRSPAVRERTFPRSSWIWIISSPSMMRSATPSGISSFRRSQKS
jgi:DNA-binding NtrC family response regulator